MQLSDIRSRVRRYTGIDMTTLFSDEEIDAEINDAYDEILDAYDWEFLELDQDLSVTEGDNTYSLPVALDRVHSLVIETGAGKRMLRQRSEQSYDTLTETLDQDVPTEYILRTPNELEVYPPPDGSYTIVVRGRRIVDDLEADVDVPIFAEQYHILIALVASVTILQQEGDDGPRSESYAARAQEIMQRMYLHYQVQHDDAPGVLGGRHTKRARRIARQYMDGEL